MLACDGKMESQIRKLQGNLKTSSNKYKPKEEALSGFRRDHPRGCFRSWWSFDTLWLLVSYRIRTPVSHVPQAGAADLPIVSGSIVASDSRQSTNQNGLITCLMGIHPLTRRMIENKTSNQLLVVALRIKFPTLDL
ncbi:hypothetical protein OPV22_029929 [Ensete ventricosum]|uniref:Uncharacterized protein n=1 Tax=Ensete ventricosum TaxID=4639 RepID=A0AAV8Q2H3_ENSVE|nr:hypothetical protein OPV22_029929 [Ensete ventricosum]